MDAHQRGQLQPLLLPDLKETGKELGRGAYGVVTEVIVSGTTCAAKKLHDAIVQSFTLRRFGDEVLLHSQQRHPNIVQLIGVYYPPRSQLPMLVMEYLPLSLTQCLEREELPLQMKYSILLDVAKGLCYLHGKRPPIVHRDLTANNVLLTSSYSAKISDLGVSRLADTFKKHHLTTAPGNAMVMPPEALKDIPVYDHKLDVFSYGCLILHVLTGQFPEPTDQFVPEPGRKDLFKRVSEWDRRSNYIKSIPKENELLPLAKDCLTDAPTSRPEMIDSYVFVEKVLSKYPKIKSMTELMKENEAAEKHICELDAELKVLKAKNNELEKQLTADNERLMGNYDQLRESLRNILSQVTGLQNALSLKEKEFNDCTEVLKEMIRSRDEQLVKLQQNNMDQLKKKESDLKENHLIELATMKEEYEAKLLTAAKKHEQQLSKTCEECEIRVAEVMKVFTVESRQALLNATVSTNEILSSLQSLPLASIPSYQTQKELIQPVLSQRLKKGDKWCLVDKDWFKRWKKYTGFDSMDQETAGLPSGHPGPIDTAILFKSNVSEALNDHLMEELDYALLPEPAWNLLLSWYGLSVGSRPIIRNVVEYGTYFKHLGVEVYFIDLKLCVHPHTTDIKTGSFSRADTISRLFSVIKEQFNIPDTTECRLWQRYMANSYELLTNLRQTIPDAGIYGGQMILLEIKNPDGTWSRTVQHSAIQTSSSS
ncbi:PREDICTED: probable serine/threonine-protein kinase kinY [Amphimedon queenslandica]|uniref:DUSP domain-containing protein n=1 Tax=Amphimedon queenslandica TaxID=400682 RepID=A0A1X7TAJ9_AMPQE|nr:PREDICTED: probable serine/threonine-protein kinase kinY [Amphimedon queenslandica]|eukprot:XP_011407941.1 PREDICTED: probable serine/threonine-protein kinase kinY [Amphimedon queenslandica]